MAENKKSFVAYCDWMETFEALPDEKAGQLAKHLFRYVNDLSPETDDILIKAVFANIKHTLKRDLKKYETIKLKRSESGKLGGRPSKQTKAKKANAFCEKQTKAKKAVSDSDNVSVNVNDNVKCNNNITTATEILKLLNSLPEEKINEMKELTLFKGNLEDLKIKFSVEFIERYGLNKTEKEIIETFQSWMHKNKLYEKIESNSPGSKKSKQPSGNCKTTWD